MQHYVLYNILLFFTLLDDPSCGNVNAVDQGNKKGNKRAPKASPLNSSADDDAAMTLLQVQR